MNRHKVAIIIIFCTLVFLPYFFSPIFGADSYYFLNEIQGKETPYVFETDPLMEIIMPLLPANEIIIKFLLLGLMVASSIILAYLGELIVGKHGWLAGILCFFGLIYLKFFLKLENDTFAYPFIFASLYFVVKAYLSEKKTNKVIWGLLSLHLLVFACLFWKASALFFIPLSFISLLFLVPALAILILKLNYVLGVFQPNNLILENQMVAGIAIQGLLIAGLVSLPMYFVVPTLFFFMLAFMNAKYSMLLIPFLVIGLTKFISKFLTPQIKKLITAMILFCILINLLAYINFLPNQQVFEGINIGIQASKDTGLPIKNNWSYGYWISYLGGTPSTWGFGKEEDQNYFENSIAITYQDLNCAMLYGNNFVKTFNCGHAYKTVEFPFFGERS